jgi:signal transduction histidine kinase
VSIVRSMSEERAIAPASADPGNRGDRGAQGAQGDLAGLRQARAQHQAVLRWLRGLSPVLILVIVVAAVRVQPGPGITGRGLVVSVAMAGVAAGFGGAVWGTTRRARRRGAAGGAVLIASSAALMWAQPAGPGAASALVGILFLARLLPARIAVTVSAAAFAALTTVAAIIGHGRGPSVALLAALAGFIGMLFLTGRLGAANDQAELLLAELRASRAAEARAAGLAERQRLAREMHDVLAHSLSGLLLKLEGARMLAARDPLDPRLPETIDEAHHLAGSGLAEARRAIGALRGEQMPGPDRLPELAARFGQDRGIPCRLTVSGAEHSLGADTRLAVYRVAQEALTNIAKHAHPDRVELSLAYEPGATRLTVEDFIAVGAAAYPGRLPVSANGGGYGLAGMRERAELIGGTLSAGVTPTGFRVELEVPE